VGESHLIDQHRTPRNRALGLAGELTVVAHERHWLISNGREDLAERVRHVAALEGDGAGYDVESFELNSSTKFIEVKTTRDGAETPFFISSNEVEFSKRHSTQYALYRDLRFRHGARQWMLLRQSRLAD